MKECVLYALPVFLWILDCRSKAHVAESAA